MVVSSGLRNVRVRSTTITIASAAVITLLFLPLTVFAQQQEEETAFLPYENPTYGIFMQYPSNWAASTSGLADHTDVVAFYSPLQNVSDLSQARLIISVILYSQNVSLQEYTNYLGTILNQSEQVDVRNSSEVTVAGHPGHRVVLANQPAQNTTLTFYQMNTWTTIGNKVYLLTYQGEEPAFNQYLPEVSRMLESLSIRSNNNMTTTAADIENQIQ
jgi:PsbP-like protein